MKPKLPRALLWRDKKTLDELLKVPYGEQLVKMFLETLRGTKMRGIGVHVLPILNEAFYQSTRVVYEKDPDAKVRDYAADIRANVGGMQETTRIVLMLMMYLLMTQSDRSLEVTTFVGRLRLYYKPAQQYELELGVEESFLSAYPYEKGNEGFFLTPEPCPADELEGMVIDWKEVTRCYSKQMIKEVVMLWCNSREQSKVLRMIVRDYNKRTLALFEEVPEDVADEKFFSEYRESLGADDEDEGPVCEACGEPISCCMEESEEYAELEKKYLLMEKRNNELETENVQLKSELNNRKQKSKQERAFTLPMIVDYCKNRAELRQVEEIIKMLNKFLRKNGSDEEYALVDGIEDHFAKKAAAMVFMDNHGTVNNNR